MYHNVVVYERHNERTAMQITTGPSVEHIII